ncbi:MAG: OmpA family protein [Myxococcaceae bacterium]|jgi:outer membrane protein OmpA-like peptidoglycan-associated protein|nr:OmpA family protein [Myxococcaceae bacterium]MCA3014420.1 OmpA family protein [Myxococcaceae bacterium]
MHARFRLVTLTALVAALAAHAEKAPVNIHLDVGGGTGLDRAVPLTGATLKVDTTVLSFLGPVSPQVELFGKSTFNNFLGYLDQGAAFGAGLGVRLRLFNDEKGYFFNPGTKHRGNLWGNWYFDAHVLYAAARTATELGVGFDVGTGYEFSLVEALHLGPVVTFRMMGPHQVLMAGLSISIGAPDTIPAEADFDDDGISGDADKCPDQSGLAANNGCPVEDKDKDGLSDKDDKCQDKAGPKENGGCPDEDKDADGVVDRLDTCPAAAGPLDNKGCPWGDADKDGLTDNLDKCPDLAGPGENAGCPDTDKDGDGTVDRLDACLDAAGEKDNKGCAYPDTDKDGVNDRVDNCINETGPAANQGCPEKQKQLVAITREKLVLKEKLAFDQKKATLQKRSFTTLDQVASVLATHPEIVMLQVEGHTDNAGVPEDNRALSQARADAVRDYLVKKGVAEARLKAVGFGQEKPLGSNDTPQGREDNRRIEFVIIGR